MSRISLSEELELTGTAGHHHGVTEQLLTDRTEQLGGNVDLQSDWLQPSGSGQSQRLYLHH